MGSTPNPNWPILTTNADFTQGPPYVPGVNAMSLNAPLRRNAVRQIDITRGRQYELDQVQAGTATLTITDPLEYLHPSNVSSPFNAGGNMITSYRCCQIGAWWNPATQSTAGNFLATGNQAPGQPSIGRTYGYDPNFEAFNLGIAVLPGDGSTATSVSSPADGTFPVTQVSLTGTSSYWVNALRCVPGQSYTLTVDVYASAGVTVKVDTGTGALATTSTTGAYQALTIGPFTALSAQNVSFTAATTGSYPAVFYVANIRLTGVMPAWSKTAGASMSCTLAQAHSGTYSLGAVMQAPGDTVSVPMPTGPGFTYTMSAWCFAAAAGTVATMTVGGTSVSTTTTGVWQRLSTTFTPSDAVTTVSWAASAATTYPATIYVDDIQLEVAATASAFTTSGPTFYPIYTGYIERYPLQWDMGGTRGIRPLTCTDALSILSRTQIAQSYATTILADNPMVYIPYNDQSIPQRVQLPSGGQPMQGYENVGTSGSVNFQGDTFLDGTAAVSVVQQNANPPVSGNNAYVTYLGTRAGAVTMNPQSFALEFWLKAVSGTVYLGAAAVPATENPNGEALGPNKYIGIYTAAGKLFFTFTDPNGGGNTAGYSFPGISGYPDGQWHYIVVQLTGSNQLQLTADSSIGGHGSLGFTPSASVALNNFFVDATTYFGDPITDVSIANLAAYQSYLSSTQMKSHYNRGAGYIGEVSGARVLRLLNQYWAGAVSVSPGYRRMAPDYSYTGRFVLDVLQEIQETERGLVYASTAGVVVFEDSVSRYASQAAKWVLGENPAGASPAEYPYADIVQDFDPTYTFSQTNLTRPANSSFGPLPNPLPSNPPYGQRVLSQQVQVNSDFDLKQASVFYLKRYGAPKVRVEKLTLNAAANPALWPVILGLEISQRITVTRRTLAGLTTSSDYYVEQINHHIDAEASTWTVDLQCSPVYNSSAWILGDATYGVLGTTTIPVY